ncbi:hypothetical protein [Dactylosporangium sp. NPDC051541]|uniref:hypothetical protein n=1 Tax=Dactylosporangium sp. NPDC051541 TaxID=3363977 RepID=UPI0037A57430
MWHAHQTSVDRLLVRLVYAQQLPVAGRLIAVALMLRGTDIAPSALTARGLVLPHSGIGVVVHSKARIGQNVTLFQGVTVGRADMWRAADPDWSAPIVEDEAILCANATVVAGRDEVRIGRGAVVGANTVITRSIPAWEIWAGSPARKVGERDTDKAMRS